MFVLVTLSLLLYEGLASHCYSEHERQRPDSIRFAENERSECQLLDTGPRRSLAAIFTRSGRDSAFIFRIT